MKIFRSILVVLINIIHTSCISKFKTLYTKYYYHLILEDLSLVLSKSILFWNIATAIIILLVQICRLSGLVWQTLSALCVLIKIQSNERELQPGPINQESCFTIFVA